MRAEELLGGLADTLVLTLDLALRHLELGAELLLDPGRGGDDALEADVLLPGRVQLQRQVQLVGLRAVELCLEPDVFSAEFCDNFLLRGLLLLDFVQLRDLLALELEPLSEGELFGLRRAELAGNGLFATSRLVEPLLQPLDRLRGALQQLLARLEGRAQVSDDGVFRGDFRVRALGPALELVSTGLGRPEGPLRLPEPLSEVLGLALGALQARRARPF